MSRQIDFDKPLSDDDRAWLHEWSQDWRIEENERKFGKPEAEQESFAAQQESPAQPELPTVGSANLDPSLEDQIAALTVAELKEELSEIGQSSEGNKKELQERLLKALKD